MHRVVVAITYLLLGGALVFALLALRDNPDWDRISIALSLLAAVTGLILDRWVAERERRRELLRGLAHELYVARDMLYSNQMNPANVPQVAHSYPTMPLACLHTCLASGVFTERKDAEVLRRMYTWRLRATEFNEKLMLTQHLGLTADRAGLAAHHRAITASATTNATRQAVQALIDHMVERYESETDIGAKTKMLPVD